MRLFSIVIVVFESHLGFEEFVVLNFASLIHFLVWHDDSLLCGQNVLLSDLGSKLLELLTLLAMQGYQFMVKVLGHLLQLLLKRCLEL